jgi:hypothetical protein
MSCSVNRWGKGTTCERPSNSEAAKELQARIAAMSQERAKQDMMWTQSSVAAPVSSAPVSTAPEPATESAPAATPAATKRSDTR